MRPKDACLFVLLPVVGCLETGRSASPQPADQGVELQTSDWQGRPSDHLRLARRPRLRIAFAPGFAEIDAAVLLLTGEPDAELLDDLVEAPLRAENLRRKLTVTVASTESGALLVPDATLAADATYTLAVPAWARTRDGARISPDSTPQVFVLHTSELPSAGARPVESFPADGASAVGTNLEAAIVSFDGEVRNFEHGVWLEGPDGLAVTATISAGVCANVAPEHSANFCVRIVPSQRLVPGALHALNVGAEARDGHGAPVGPWRASFRSAAGRDDSAPHVLPLTCAVDEQELDVGCALIDDQSITLRLQSDEAVVAELTRDDVVVRTFAPDGLCVLRLASLEPESNQELMLMLRDSSGNRREEPLSLRTLPPLATLSITEMRADPRGPEPTQEYVELWNYGSRVVDLEGYTLDDRSDKLGEPFARSLRVEPQTYVLLVAEAFNADDPRDQAPPPGASLLRLGRSLASSGLSNTGERIYLRDAQGRRVSAAPATPKPRAGVCIVRVSPDGRDGAASAFDYDSESTCTPGW
jgi:hypothetical protein